MLKIDLCVLSNLKSCVDFLTLFQLMSNHIKHNAFANNLLSYDVKNMCMHASFLCDFLRCYLSDVLEMRTRYGISVVCMHRR